MRSKLSRTGYTLVVGVTDATVEEVDTRLVRLELVRTGGWTSDLKGVAVLVKNGTLV